MECLWMYLKLLYRKNQSLFLLLLLIQITLACGVHFIYLKLYASEYQINTYQQDIRTFVVAHPGSISGLESCPFQAESVWLYNEAYNLKAFAADEMNEVNQVAPHFGISSISEKDWDNCILLAVDHLYKSRSDTYALNDMPLTILGKCDSYLEESSIIPLSAFESSRLQTDKIYITSQAKLTASEVELHHTELQFLFPDAVITDPITRSYALEETFEDTDLLMIVMLLLALLTEGYFILYLRRKCAAELAMIRILGATAFQNASGLTISILIILVIQSLAGALVFFGLLLPLMRRYDAVLALVVDWKAIVLPQVMIAGFVVLSCIPVIRNRRLRV